MESSKKEKLLEDIRAVVREEVSPVLDILMTYLDVQFDISDEKFQHLFGGIEEVLEKFTAGRE
jgi:hypothetical protein